MTIGDFLNNLAKMAGIPASEPALVSFLSKAEIATATIDDTIAAKINGILLTLESAKQNPELKSYYTAQALNGLDSYIKEISEEFQLPDEIKAELTNEKSSYKRAGLLARKVKELESKRVQATSGDKDKLTQQINELNAKIAEIQNKSTNDINQLVEKHKADRIQWELNSIYNGYNYAMPLSKEANTKLAHNLLMEALEINKLKLENVDNSVRLLTNEGTEYYKDNQKISLKDFVDKTLVGHKVIVIDGQQEQHKNQQRQTVIPQTNKNSKFINAIDAELAASQNE